MNRQDLQKVLWDINEDRLNELPADFIIQRVLSYGGLGLLAKTMHEYGVSAMKRVFGSMKPTSIPARKYHYLKNFFLA